MRAKTFITAAAPALLLLGVAAAPPSQPEQPAGPPPARVLVFPADTPTGIAEQFVDVIRDVEEGRLRATHKYTTSFFVRNAPAVKRAVNEGTIKPGDASPPYNVLEKAKLLCTLMGFQRVLVTSVDDYEYDQGTGTISMVMSARLVDFSKPKAEAMFGAESFKSAPKAAKDDKDVDAGIAAARECIDKVMKDLLTPPKPPKATPPSR